MDNNNETPVVNSNGNPISTPLVYTELSGVDTSVYTNLLLIDSNVRDYHNFVTSAKSDTFPVVYSWNSSRDDLLALVSGFSNLKRIGLVFETNDDGQFKPFLNTEVLFTESDYENVTPFSPNMNFIISLIQTLGILNIDYLACDTLNFTHWTKYYAVLMDKTNVIVGASNDKTGNIKYGGDWVLESTGQYIENIYFTSNIQYHTYLLAISNHTMVIMNGAVYGTGANANGQLGIGSTTSPQTSLIAMTNNTGKTPESIGLGNVHTLIIMTDGTVYATGINWTGNLGTGNTTQQTSLVATTMPSGKTAKMVSCGQNFSAVLMTDGTVYGTGHNTNGQLGTGNTTAVFSLTLMTNNTGKTPTMISCGNDQIIVLMTDGTIYGCGANSNGQLGIGSSSSPITSLTLMTNSTGKTPKLISAGSSHTIVMMTDGTLYGTGVNSNGEMGLGVTSGIKTTLTSMPNNTGKTPTNISAGLSYTIVLMTDGTVYGTGSNTGGQLGIGSTGSPVTSLVAMTNSTGKTPSTITATGQNNTVVLMTDGTVYGTGLNTSGHLGINNTTSPITSLTQMKTNSGSSFATSVSYVAGSIVVQAPPTSNVLTTLVLYNKTITFSGYSAVLDISNGISDISGSYILQDPTAKLDLSVNTISFPNIASPFTVSNLLTGDNSLNFLVKASDSLSQQAYSVKVYVQKSNKLSTLYLNKQTITFDASYNGYLDVSYGIDDISGSYYLVDSIAKVDLSINNLSYSNIGVSFDVPLLVSGDNSLNFVVKSSDGSSKQPYFVKVHVKKSNVLTTLVLNNKTITFSGYSAVLDISNGISDISGSYILQDPIANLDLSVNTVSFPNIASPFTVSNLLTGDNSLNFLVKASDGLSQQAYYVKVDVAELSSFQSLSLNGQTITFTNYAATIQIPYYIYDLSGTYTVSDINSSIDLSVNSTFYSSISSNFNFQLNQQNNVLTFLIKASDGFSSRSYNVNILKSSSKVSCVLEGTFVWTDKGCVPIETICEGDSIRTDNYLITVTKVGKWSVDLNNEEDRNDLSKKMYKISAGTHGCEYDTYISHYHRLLVDENTDSEEESRVFRLPTSLGLPFADPSEFAKDGKYTLYHLQLAIGNHYIVNGCCKVESWKTNMKYF
jgi:alpha-tubulin suppressor-like RCC1 family protein